MFMVVRGGLPGMFGPCKADLTKRRIRPRPRARASSISLSREHRNAGRIALSPTGRRSISYEYCCPRRYMTSSAAWCSPKICTEARTLFLPSLARGHIHSEMSREPFTTKTFTRDENRDLAPIAEHSLR